MNLDYFQYIVLTSECGSINKAAEKLHMRQQNLSGIIRKMEQYYGISIFDRTTKGISLTRDGEYFIENAKEILKLTEKLEQSYRYPSKRHYANVVDQMTLYVPDLVNTTGRWWAKVKEFNHIFPYIDLHILTRPSSEALNALVADEKSVAAILSPFFESNFVATLPEGLTATKLSQKIYCAAITRQNNPEALGQSEISVHDLLKKKLVICTSDALENNIFYQLLNHFETPKIQHILDNSSLFVDFMLSGNYWSLAQFPKDYEDQNQLRYISLKEDIYVTLYWVYQQKSSDSFIMQTLIKLLSDNLW